MDKFQDSLAAWLSNEGNTQTALASAIGKSQVAVRRYALGERFPDAETAMAIEKATDGGVPFAVWHNDFLTRSGLGFYVSAGADGSLSHGEHNGR